MKRQSQTMRVTLISSLTALAVGVNDGATAEAAGAARPAVKITPKALPHKNLRPKLSPKWWPAKGKAKTTPPRRVRAPLPDPYPDPCRGLEGFSRRKVPFSIGEELAYELSVSGAMVGRMELKVGKPRRVEGKTRLPLFGRARTSSFLTTFKAFEGRYMTMVDPQSLTPLGLLVESTYGEDERTERVRFTKNQRFVGADVTLEGRQLRREYDGEHDLTDLLSLLYVARTMELEPGMEVCQDVFASRRLWRMTAKVSGIEVVDTPAGDKDAWVVKTQFDRKPTYGLNNNKRPYMEVDIYLAKDGSQTPLQFVVRTQGVEAKGTLVRWSLEGSTPDARWEL